MSPITLRKALGVLAKSSSFSVATITHRQKDVFDELKHQLFVKQEIEVDLQQYLHTAKSGEIIFLCGSSGDGKSEILTRCRTTPYYQQKFDFHLDATHSFSPRQSAIDALNELFDKHKAGERPLLLGINTGMLANYAMEGAEQHQDIRSIIDAYLSDNQRERGAWVNNSCCFFDFEHYPKFQFDESKNYSPFIKSLIKNLTKEDDKNLFHVIAQKDELAGHDLQVVANFKMLSKPGVQDVLITQLFKSRLMKEQFVTTRALLDLLHHLLLGPGYLFDNLFSSEENELVKKISGFDPVRLHTHELDQFILRYELGLNDPDLDEFLTVLAQQHIYFERHNANASSLIRLFWLFRNESLGNNYHQQFNLFFDEKSFERYAQIWHLHRNYTAEAEQKKTLHRFYASELIAGIQRYANRKAPELSTQKEEFFLGEYDGVKITAPMALKPDWGAILKRNTVHPTCFEVHLKVGANSLLPVRIGLNLFELLGKLNNGYRPNKYDKNAIVLLDEIVELMTEQAKSSTELRFYDSNHRIYTVRTDDDMITVSSMDGVA
ncbi:MULTISPECIES: DNA phosphorothioation-dependent restriction protein DptF [unclassified Photorhabdus]|uniref:DNA phosphorothioation-dependent restriction protein DptF n=1 Tax=unclassified Photorhabdus TaxID=2620880 RepID=UPI000DCB1652|nr:MULTISPECIES: DNA phosphorothioation-dependent restriction protein DptF [unclassified Photorhabdus]RAW99268.1 DNA phosphorothioation-dependent restriction protein DptF [Photorhabdus sp. S10-54]RAW99350.1 DNA phosphorothioation-dependent restriction protein DptF [Photorhabdus sp. S9-53]RAX03555.1 DNA phosphorothioation-dependent restriction protein DptF [Photorhabdus sp. S8-52]